MKENSKKGAILVVGGGIGGIQASLDIANSGFKVYLVEKESSISGNIAQLCCKATKKCNECSVCHVSERMFEVLSHPEISVLTNAKITEVKGGPGKFNVRVKTKSQAITLNVGAIILTIGFTPFDAEQIAEYGYGKYKNVITALELERMIQEHKINELPESIAFIQCVGSRYQTGSQGRSEMNYCSSVCCTYAIKNAIKIKDYLPGTNITIFGMDIRTYDKGAESYYKIAQSKYEMRFVRARISSIELAEDRSKKQEVRNEDLRDFLPASTGVRLEYETEEGKLKEEEFDMVVLSTGFAPPQYAKELAKIIGIELNEYGFSKTTALKPLRTTRQGIFVAGAFQEPKGILETVTQASGAVCEASALLRLNSGQSASGGQAFALQKRDLIREYPIVQRALVIGGGLAGITSALGIARQGYEVSLIECEPELGGNLRNIYYTLSGEDVQKHLKSLRSEVENHPKIKVYKGTSIDNIDGYIGNYKTVLKTHDSRLTTHEFEHGIIIVATGAGESKPTEYLYGEDARVITQLELEKRLAETKSKKQKAKTRNVRNLTSDICHLSSIVMIQCVGSRDNERAYCSRVCCQHAIKNALKIKDINPEVQVFILHRDIRTYGFREKSYALAREKGVCFIRYDEEKKPHLCKNGKSITVKMRDPVLQEELVIPADLLVLSSAIVPNKSNPELAKLLKIPLDDDGFFSEAQGKLSAVNSPTDGIFLAGMSHSPKTIDESISQSLAAAAKAVTILSKPTYLTGQEVVQIDEDICSGCGVCESTCNYGAIQVITQGAARKAKIIEVLCKGCGTCAAACPSGAIQQQGFKSSQMLAVVDSALHD